MFQACVVACPQLWKECESTACALLIWYPGIPFSFEFSGGGVGGGRQSGDGEPGSRDPPLFPSLQNTTTKTKNPNTTTITITNTNISNLHHNHNHHPHNFCCLHFVAQFLSLLLGHFSAQFCSNSTTLVIFQLQRQWASKKLLKEF